MKRVVNSIKEPGPSLWISVGTLTGQPGEEILSNYPVLQISAFGEQNIVIFSVDCLYCLNGIFKRKYNAKLQELPRMTLLIKGSDRDVKQKAAIFDDVLFSVADQDPRSGAFLTLDPDPDPE